ncbi:MAG: hypothetical protein ABI743_00055 [bacterium]
MPRWCSALGSSSRATNRAAQGLVALLVWMFALATPGLTATLAPATISAARAIPAPIQERIVSLVDSTLGALFGEGGTLTAEALAADPVRIGEQIRTGLNLELEDRGYHLTALTLTPGDPIRVEGTLDLIGAGVEGVRLVLAPMGLPAFWQRRHDATLARVGPDVMAHYEPALIGLPIAPASPEWSRNLALAALPDPPPSLSAAFPDFTVSTALELADEALLTVTLVPQGPVLDSFRVEARSESLLIANLDSVEERLAAEAALVVGQPVALVQANQAAIAEALAALAGDTETARNFQTSAPEVTLVFPPQRPTEIRATVLLESEVYHLRAEAFVDIGNEDRPAEFQGLAGYRFAESMEAFVVLNLLTEDPQVSPDFGLGLYSGSAFAGGAWDAQEGTWKGYATWNPSPWIRLSAEVYAERDEGQTQLGISWQPTKQLGFGAFTDGDELVWLRTSFRL